MENLIIVLLAVTYLIILSLGVKAGFKIHHSFLSGKKISLILFFSLCSILYGKAQTANEMIAGNFSDNDLAINNPIKVNYELEGVPVTPPTINSQVLKIDDNNSIVILIENDNSSGSEVSIVKIIANGVTTQKLVFKGDSMSCVGFPSLERAKNTAKKAHDRCE
jgi:hypothetical protein